MNINDKKTSNNGRPKFNIPKLNLERGIGVASILIAIIMVIYLIAS